MEDVGVVLLGIIILAIMCAAYFAAVRRDQEVNGPFVGNPPVRIKIMWDHASVKDRSTFLASLNRFRINSSSLRDFDPNFDSSCPPELRHLAAKPWVEIPSDIQEKLCKKFNEDIKKNQKGRSN